MNEFAHEYDPKSIKKYDVSGFRFSLTPRFKSHYLESDKPYEWLTVKVFNAMIRPGSTVVDVGAHYGYYTLNAAREVGRHGTVIAVEPVAFNNSILKTNVIDNGFKKAVKVFNNPVSNTEKEVTFNITEASDNGGFYDHPNTRILESVTLKAVTLDGLLNEYTDIPVIKIDAEGHECEILEAGKKVIASQQPALFLEFNPKCLIRASHEPEDMLHIVQGLGYKILFIDDRNDKFIACSRPAKQWKKLIDPMSYINLVALPKKRYKTFIKGCPAVFGTPLQKM